MTILAVCNHKGGTGKTTSTINLAAALGLSGYRPLVVDLDPQGFLTRMLGLDEPAAGASSLVLFNPDHPLGALPVTSLAGFDVLPSSMAMTRAMRQLGKPTDVLWVREALQARLDYDLVLIDTAAAVTVFSLNALVAAQHVLIPVTPEYQPVVGAEQTHQTVSLVQDKLNPRLGDPIFLFTQVDARKKSHHQYRQYMRERHEDQVMQRIIRTSSSLAHQHPDGTTVFEHAPYSRGSRDYANAADELLRRLQLGPPGAEPEAEAPSEDPAPETIQDAIASIKDLVSTAERGSGSDE